MATTATEYLERLKQSDRKINQVPQPYGRSVAELIEEFDAAGNGTTVAATLAHILAHALHDLDVALGKTTGTK